MTPEERSEIARRGGLARARQFTRESQQAARAKVRTESLRASGRKGWQATYAANPELAGKIAADWRINNPSRPEQTVAAWLAELGIAAEREVSLHGLYLDFAAGDMAIEVDGHGIHSRMPNADQRQANDERKEMLCYALGYRLIRIPECAVRDGSGRAQLINLLEKSS